MIQKTDTSNSKSGYFQDFNLAIDPFPLSADNTTKIHRQYYG